MNSKFKNVLLIVLLLVVNYATAQDPLGEGLDQATNNLSSNFSKIRNFLYILSAVVASYGAIKVYGKFQNQDQDTTKAMGLYGFGFIFFFAAGYIIDATFL